VLGYAERVRELSSRTVRDSRVNLDMAVDRLTLRIPDTTNPRARVDDLLRRAKFSGSRLVESTRQNLATVKASLAALGPEKILARGYSIARNESGKVGNSVGDFAEGERITVLMSDGSVDGTVDAVNQETADE